LVKEPCRQFHQSFTHAFFVQNFGAKNHKAVFWVWSFGTKNFVRKMGRYNVDEIDSWFGSFSKCTFEADIRSNFQPFLHDRWLRTSVLAIYKLIKLPSCHSIDHCIIIIQFAQLSSYCITIQFAFRELIKKKVICIEIILKTNHSHSFDPKVHRIHY